MNKISDINLTTRNPCFSCLLVRSNLISVYQRNHDRSEKLWAIDNEGDMNSDFFVFDIQIIVSCPPSHCKLYQNTDKRKTTLAKNILHFQKSKIWICILIESHYSPSRDIFNTMWKRNSNNEIAR